MVRVTIPDADHTLVCLLRDYLSNHAFRRDRLSVCACRVFDTLVDDCNGVEISAPDLETVRLAVADATAWVRRLQENVAAGACVSYA